MIILTVIIIIIIIIIITLFQVDPKTSKKVSNKYI